MENNFIDELSQRFDLSKDDVLSFSENYKDIEDDIQKKMSEKLASLDVKIAIEEYKKTILKNSLNEISNKIVQQAFDKYIKKGNDGLYKKTSLEDFLNQTVIIKHFFYDTVSMLTDKDEKDEELTQSQTEQNSEQQKKEGIERIKKYFYMKTYENSNKIYDDYLKQIATSNNDLFEAYILFLKKYCNIKHSVIIGKILDIIKRENYKPEITDFFKI